MVPSITNSLTVAREEVKLGVHVYYIVSMTTTTTNSLRHFSLKFLLHSSNSLKVPRTEMKLGTHAFNIISMTTTLFSKVLQKVERCPSYNVQGKYFLYIICTE